MVRGWTEAEKLGLLFQIIAQAGPIPWDKLVLPEGRTRKACEVMVDKEKQKVKKAREGGDGEEGTGEGEGKAKTGTKRKANDDGASTPKKAKTPRKKKVQAGADEEAVGCDDDKEAEKKDMVKDEPDEEGDEF